MTAYVRIGSIPMVPYLVDRANVKYGAVIKVEARGDLMMNACSRGLLKALVLPVAMTICMSSGHAADNGSGSGSDLRNPIPAGLSENAIKPEKVKKDKWIAYRLAKYQWLDKVVAADPRLVAAITAHSGPAKVLAQHKHLDKIADADHYLCRRLTQWEGATQKLIRNPYFDHVIDLDPAGFYFAMNRKPEYARVVIRQTNFDDLATNDRDVLREITRHMK